jgi:hypothetical protein
MQLLPLLLVLSHLKLHDDVLFLNVREALYPSPFNLKVTFFPLGVVACLFQLLFQDCDFILCLTELFVKLSVFLNELLFLTKDDLYSIPMLLRLNLELIVDLGKLLIELLSLAALSVVLLLIVA